MWQFDKFTNTFIPGTLPADGSKITACYDRLSQEDEQEGDSISIQNQRDFLRTYCEDHRFPTYAFSLTMATQGRILTAPAFRK